MCLILSYLLFLADYEMILERWTCEIRVKNDR